MGKKVNMEVFKEHMQKNPLFLYQKVVEEAQEVTLPLISKVIDHKLVLKDYTLDSGHMRGLAKAVQESTL